MELARRGAASNSRHRADGKDGTMEGFDPKTSFGYEVSKRYDVHRRGDEDETVAFLARQAAGCR